MAFPFDLFTNLTVASFPLAQDRRDLLDPSSGVVQGARFINLQTGDYEVNEQGHFIGMNDIQQKVQLAMLTTFGSADSPIGNTFADILLITPNLQAQVQAAVNAALANLLNKGYIIFTKPLTVVRQGQNTVNVTVYWMDVQTKQNFQNTVVLGQGI